MPNRADTATLLRAIDARTSVFDFEAARDIEASLLREIVIAAARGEDVSEAASEWYSAQDETRADYLYRVTLEQERAEEEHHAAEMALTLSRPEDSTPEERIAADLGFAGW